MLPLWTDVRSAVEEYQQDLFCLDICILYRKTGIFDRHYLINSNRSLFVHVHSKKYGVRTVRHTRMTLYVRSLAYFPLFSDSTTMLSLTNIREQVI